MAVYMAWPSNSGDAELIHNKAARFSANNWYWRVRTKEGDLLLTEFEFERAKERAEANPEDL